MSIFINEKENHSAWGIWTIEEEVPELLQQLQPNEKMLTQLNQFHSDTRKKEWLTVRMLLHELGGDPCQIEYYPSGRPYLKDHSFHFSCSHTKGYSAAIIHPTQHVGIDIEQIASRILKVRSRFMHPYEEQGIDKSEELTALILHWSAKETLFKVLQKENVDFKEHIRIDPFKVNDQGLFYAHESRTEKNNSFQIAYRVYKDFVITQTIH